ncbi:MAG: DUF1318 domain-containing protein [candidate division Zixibacteria bacterium]|nr:DUF1318 domain-containing protein [Candidatus Tariuqbacter arcticus]
MENQIVGFFRMIEEEAWMVASLRAASLPDSIALTEGKRRVLQAFQRQRFNADDIADFKRSGVIGEKTDGFLEIIPSPQYEGDSAYRALVDRVTLQENEDRTLIMRRIVEMHPEIDPEDRIKVGEVYARLKQEASPSGTWIQQSDGSWKRK